MVKIMRFKAPVEWDSLRPSAWEQYDKAWWTWFGDPRGWAPLPRTSTATAEGNGLETILSKTILLTLSDRGR